MYIFYIYQGENQTMNKLFEYMDFFHGTQLSDPINRLNIRDHFPFIWLLTDFDKILILHDEQIAYIYCVTLKDRSSVIFFCMFK